MRVGFVNGCFDILHIGHIGLFEFAKSHCDKLVVALDTDERVRCNKGSNRPFNTLLDRALMVASIMYVDEVKWFATDEELTSLVRDISPDVMVVGEEYATRRVIGAEHAKELKFFRKIDGYSTTNILESTSGR